MHRFENILEKTIDGIYDLSIVILDLEGKIIGWNKGSEKMKGFNTEEVIGKNFKIFFALHDINSGIPEQLLEKALNEKNTEYTGWRIRKNGSSFWGHVELKLIENNNHEPLGYTKITRDLSNQKKTEDIKSILLDSSSDAILCYDSDGKITNWNKQAEQMFGWTKDEVEGKSFYTLIIPEKYRETREISKYYTTKNNFTLHDNDITALKKDGEEFPIEYSVVPYDFNGEYSYCMFIQDITIIKQAQRVNKINEARFRTLIENSEDVIFITHPNGVPFYITPSVFTILGYSETEILQINLLELIHEEDRKYIQIYFCKEKLSRNINESHNIRLLHKNLGWRWMNFISNNLMENSLINGIVFNFRDVTEKVLAKNKIEQQEKYFRALVENSNEMIILTDADRKITYVSPSVNKIMGFRDDEILGKKSTEFMHPDQQIVSTYIYDRLLNNPGVPFPRTNRLLNKEGNYIWVEGTVVNLLEDKNVASVISNYKDISERKIFEQKIINLNRVYAFISQMNQTIVHVKDEQALFMEVCSIAVETGKFKMAWIGILDPATKLIQPVSQAGEDNNYLYEIRKISIDNSPEGNGPTGLAIKESTCKFVNDISSDPRMKPWKEHALKRGFNSSIAIPIRKSQRTIGALTLYSGIINFFDEEEINLLEKVANDISFALDIFEKEKIREIVQEKLKKSEASLKQAQLLAHVGSWEFDLRTGKTLWSEESCKIFDLPLSKNNLSLTEWLEYIHPEDLAIVNQIIDEAGKKFIDTSFYYRIILKNQSVRYIHTQSHYQFDVKGNAITMHGIFQDITEIKKSEETIKQSEANLRQIIDLIPHSIFVRDIKGNFILSNKSYADLFEMKPEDLVNKNRKGIINYDTKTEYLLNIDQEVITTKTTQIIPEVAFIDSKGETRYFTTIKAPFVPVGLNETTVLNISNEITKLKLAELERNKVLEDILRRNNDLEQFSYITSHNLRSPVANIMGLIELLSMPDNNQADHDYMLIELNNSIKKLDGVIKDLNNILRVKNEVNEVKEPILFDDILNDIEKSIQISIIQENVEITSNFTEVPGMTTIKSYIYSTLLNLITNSIKYKQLNKTAQIHIYTVRNGNGFDIIFEDNGMGIDLKKNGEKIFGLYKRFHTHKEGKGMGLFMVKTQLEAIRGRISVESEVNVGTRFIISFDSTE